MHSDQRRESLASGILTPSFSRPLTNLAEQLVTLDQGVAALEKAQHFVRCRYAELRVIAEKTLVAGFSC
jgi:hypothetical protein